MIDRILVPLDGSALAENVLLHVRRLLRLSAAEVVLLRVVDARPLDADYVYMIGRLRDEADRYLRSVAERLAREGIRARPAVAEGLAAGTILDVAQRERASLIAMSTHGRTGLARFVFGSVAEKVLRASDAPVLLVRSFGPGGASELPFRKIVVPFDGSERSLEVASIVKELFAPLDSRVVLVHVVEPEWEQIRWALPERPMKEAAEEFIRASIPTTCDVRHGDPAAEILAAGREHEADLIAMTTHGRSGLSHWMLGSVAEKVARAATVPLLVVRSKKEAK